jgi:hypothetical protein
MSEDSHQRQCALGVASVRQVMSDVRLVHPTTGHARGGAGGQVAPADATRAAVTLLRYGWHKLVVHVRHSFLWIIFCAVLIYDSWSAKTNHQPVPAEAVANHPTIVGSWYLEQPTYTVLEFLSDGTVISRNARKEDRGTYVVKESRISMEFSADPVFWSPQIRELPDRFAISGNELSLYATSDGKDIGTAQVYRFKRKMADSEAGGDLAAWHPER